GEADRVAVDGCDQRELSRKALGQRSFVVGLRRPRGLLTRVIVVGRQLLDAGGENRSEERRIRGQERPQCQLAKWRTHRAISQVVPSLESLSTTPMAASSSRIRSDSAKFFDARARARASTSAWIFASSRSGRRRLRKSCKPPPSTLKPRKRSVAFRSHAA